MKNYMKMAAIALLMCACSREDNSVTNNAVEAERTVLVYMSGEGDLLKYTSVDDIKEMKEGSMKIGDNDNLILFVNRPDKTSSYIARVKDGELVDSTVMPTSKMTDPAVLERTLRYTREKYPAKGYALQLWGHSDGWLINKDSIEYAKTRSYGVDYWDGEEYGYYQMNMPSMARAIANGMGGKKLDYLFADCCVFMCIESAYELRNVTDYLIGSPAEIPDDGAPYHLIVPFMFDKSESFYKGLVDTYYDYYIEHIKEKPYRYYRNKPGDLEGYSLPLVVVKCDELENLAQATAQLMNTIGDKLKPGGTLNLSESVWYGCDFLDRYCHDMYYTLKINTAESDFDSWKPAFKKAVPYKKFSQYWFSIRGRLANDMAKFNAPEDDWGEVSMYFPTNVDYGSVPSWNTEIRKFQWNDVIRWEQYGWK